MDEKTTRKILFDTDMGCDSDDAGALALILELANAGECELVGVTHSTMCEAAAGCIEAILNYYGHPEVSVGSFHEEDMLDTKEWRDVYASDVARGYGTRFRRGGHYENTVKLMRKILASSEEKITIAATGPLTSLARLLESGPDEYSDLTGAELVRRKVERAVCMAGRFREQWPDLPVWSEVEWNVKCDIPAAQAVCEKWPAELIFASYEVGAEVITCGEIQTKANPGNPVRTCYEIRSKKMDNGAVGRASWDAVTVLWAIRGAANLCDGNDPAAAGLCWALHAPGKICVDEEGYTTFENRPEGKHSFLIEKCFAQEAAAVIDEILNRELARNVIV